MTGPADPQTPETPVDIHPRTEHFSLVGEVRKLIAYVKHLGSRLEALEQKAMGKAPTPAAPAPAPPAPAPAPAAPDAPSAGADAAKAP